MLPPPAAFCLHVSIIDADGRCHAGAVWRGGGAAGRCGGDGAAAGAMAQGGAAVRGGAAVSMMPRRRRGGDGGTARGGGSAGTAAPRGQCGGEGDAVGVSAYSLARLPLRPARRRPDSLRRRLPSIPLPGMQGALRHWLHPCPLPLLGFRFWRKCKVHCDTGCIRAALPSICASKWRRCCLSRDQARGRAVSRLLGVNDGRDAGSVATKPHPCHAHPVPGRDGSRVAPRPRRCHRPPAPGARKLPRMLSVRCPAAVPSRVLLPRAWAAIAGR